MDFENHHLGKVVYDVEKRIESIDKIYKYLLK